MRLLVPAALLALPLAIIGTASAQSSFPGWNVRYDVPAGWRIAQAVGRVHTLASNTDAGVMFIAPGPYGSPAEAVEDLSKFYQSLGLTAMPVEQPTTSTIGGLPATLITYSSQDQYGRVVQARFITLMTPHGTGVNLLAMTTPQQFDALRATLERMAATVRVAAPVVDQQAMAALAGKWVYYSGPSNSTIIRGGSSYSHEETVVFDGRGAFQYQTESSVNVTVPSGGAGSATAGGDQGTYAVIGSTIIMTSQKGRAAFDYVLQGHQLMAAGKTYLRQ